MHQPRHEFDVVIDAFEASTYVDREDRIGAWAEFIEHGGADTERCHAARCGAPAAPRKTELLACMAAHVGPLGTAGTRDDVRRVFFRLEPEIDVFLDLVDMHFPKALRLVAEAGLSKWSQDEIAAGILSLAQSDQWENWTRALVRRLFSGLRIESKIRIAELCIEILRSKPCLTMPHECRSLDMEHLSSMCAYYAPQLAGWNAMVTSRLSDKQRLCPDLVRDIVDLANTVDTNAIAKVHARHLERLVSLESRRVGLVDENGRFSMTVYRRNCYDICFDQTRTTIHLSDAITHFERKFVRDALMWLDVTPEGNTEIKVYEIEIYGKKWKGAWSNHRTPQDVDAFIRENVAFIRAHRIFVTNSD